MPRYKKIEKGYFISFEGGEGAGKTTQINRLAGRLMAEGYKVVATREPGGTREGEALRALLVQRDGGGWSAMAEALMLYADRVMHVERVIKPAMADGKIVISDRFADSTLAYQGYGRGLEHEKIRALAGLAIGDFTPDLTFVLDIGVEEGLRRSTKRMAAEEYGDRQTEDRFERLDAAFHERLREGFLEIAAQNPARCRVVDASRGLDDIAAEIGDIALGRLG